MKFGSPFSLSLTVLLLTTVPGLSAPDEEAEDNFKRWSEFYRTIRTGIRSVDYREQLAAVEQTEESVSFGFVMFPLDTFPPRGIEPADQPMKDRTARFIDRLTPKGGTPMAEALQHAFEKIVLQENVDTIYLLSDGEPSDALPDQLQDFIIEFNEPLGVSIHTIWVGGEGRELLQKIAEQNGGQFWEAP